MQIPLQIIFRGRSGSEAARGAIRRRAAGLDRLCEHVVSCQIAVETTVPSPAEPPGGTGASQPRMHGVQVLLRVADGEPVEANGLSDDIDLALNSAFATAKRRLQEHVRARRLAGLRQRFGRVYEPPPPAALR